MDLKMKDNVEENNDNNSTKPTCKEKKIYFFKLLENVLLTGVPQIVTERNTRRKIFRTSVFFICLSGFFYHLISFILLYLSYPTTLEVLVKFQDESSLPKPIVTICDMNGIRRTPYCSDLPDECTQKIDAESLCSHYGYFCRNKNSTENIIAFPKWMTYLYSDYDRRIVEKYGSRAADILDLYKNETKHVIFANEFGKLRNCYSLDLMHFDPEAIQDFAHVFFEMHMIEGAKVGNIMMKFDPEESFYPTQAVGAKVAIHSLDQLINPFIDGFYVKPNMRYIIQLKAIEENLLASPYSTNCTTYKEEHSEGNAASNNRQRCLVECKKEKWIKKCGCISGEYTFESDEKFCSNQSESQCIDDVNVHSCFHTCKVSCKSIYFEYEVDEVPLDNTDILTLLTNSENFSEEEWYIKNKVWYSSLNFFFKRPELLIYKYKPQFELIELFSYIGGYIGIWLGISLIAVCDFLEMLFTYFYHLCKGKIPVNTKETSHSLVETKSAP